MTYGFFPLGDEGTSLSETKTKSVICRKKKTAGIIGFAYACYISRSYKLPSEGRVDRERESPPS
jgi:hypothetical protein